MIYIDPQNHKGQKKCCKVTFSYVVLVWRFLFFSVILWFDDRLIEWYIRIISKKGHKCQQAPAAGLAAKAFLRDRGSLGPGTLALPCLSSAKRISDPAKLPDSLFAHVTYLGRSNGPSKMITHSNSLVSIFLPYSLHYTHHLTSFCNTCCSYYCQFLCWNANFPSLVFLIFCSLSYLKIFNTNLIASLNIYYSFFLMNEIQYEIIWAER